MYIYIYIYGTTAKKGARDFQVAVGKRLGKEAEVLKREELTDFANEWTKFGRHPE